MSAAPPPPSPAQPGLVALGDSITHGCGTATLGVHCQSWAQWLAEAMSLPFLNLAVDGATTADVLARQVPRVRHAHSVGVVYAGVNDVRSVSFDPEAYASALDAVLAAVTTHASRVLVCTMPLDLGRPRAGVATVGAANATIRALAARHGASVADLADLAGPTRVQADAVHLTATGQLEVADRAGVALGVHPLPSALTSGPRTRRALARFAITSHVPSLVRDLRRRAVEDVARRRAG